MRFSQILTLAATAVALPLEVAEVREVAEAADVSELAALPELVRLAERQLDRTSITENEFSRSTRCADVVFVFARGSTERGNMVSSTLLSIEKLHFDPLTDRDIHIGRCRRTAPGRRPPTQI